MFAGKSPWINLAQLGYDLRDRQQQLMQLSSVSAGDDIHDHAATKMASVKLLKLSKQGSPSFMVLGIYHHALKNMFARTG